jgi:hypothetical protein
VVGRVRVREGGKEGRGRGREKHVKRKSVNTRRKGGDASGVQSYVCCCGNSVRYHCRGLLSRICSLDAFVIVNKFVS